MKAVVLAAGAGSRLRPLTDDTPKALVTVAGRPLVEHDLDRLVGLGVEERVFVVGYHKEPVIDRFGDAYRDVPITYVHQRELLGLAHALLRAEPTSTATSSCSSSTPSPRVVRPGVPWPST